MKIALIGYGKMGHAIEEIAESKGHDICLRITRSNIAAIKELKSAKTDVAIEFTGPEAAAENLKQCIEMGIPVISGSTGWLKRYNEVEQYCRLKQGTFLYASNFSIGVNLFFQLNKQLAKLMSAHEDYDVTVHEVHHTQKKDAPSGTAITIAEQIIDILPRKDKWVTGLSANSSDLLVTSERIDPAPGTHYVRYSSAIDDVEIMHKAHNRKGFAAGAVMAAEYVFGKTGVFTMNDVLGL